MSGTGVKRIIPINLMKGSNELKLNEATMIEAIQYWLEERVFGRQEAVPKVTGVKSLNSGYSSEFTVTLESKETLDAPQP